MVPAQQISSPQSCDEATLTSLAWARCSSLFFGLVFVTHQGEFNLCLTGEHPHTTYRSDLLSRSERCRIEADHSMSLAFGRNPHKILFAQAFSEYFMSAFARLLFEYLVGLPLSLSWSFSLQCCRPWVGHYKANFDHRLELQMMSYHLFDLQE